MGIKDKISNATEEAAGKAKEAIGKVSDDEALEAEGAAEVAAAKGKQVIEQVKDSAAQAVHDIKDIAK